MLAFYPASHAVCDLIDSENIAHMVCVLDIAHCFYRHKHIYNTVESNILHTGRIMQGYIVICCTMLGLLLLFTLCFT